MKVNSISYFIILLLIGLSGCKQDGGKKTPKTVITIFHAGSLSVPIKQIADSYVGLNPGVKINLESAGSVACARKITELNKPCDIMASADFRIIEELLIPEFTDLNIQFASNSMVIAYTEKSGRANDIKKDNWIDILLDEEIIFARADPDSDPCGYRTVMTFKLAEKYYKRNGIAERLLSKDMNMIRPKEVDLIGLLQSNAIDFMFIYRSVAQQHGLRYIELPPELDLSDPELKEHYSTVSVDILGDKPGEYLSLTGNEMVYGITILRNAPEKDAAIEFMKYFLSEDGLNIIRNNGQKVFDPLVVNDRAFVPVSMGDLFID